MAEVWQNTTRGSSSASVRFDRFVVFKSAMEKLLPFRLLCSTARSRRLKYITTTGDLSTLTSAPEHGGNLVLVGFIDRPCGSTFTAKPQTSTTARLTNSRGNEQRRFLAYSPC